MTNEFTELVKTIAAFGGLLLGVINISILLYKEYFRRPKLSVTVNKAQVKCLNQGVYDIQLDIDLSSSGGTVYLKKIEFIAPSPVFDPPNEGKSRSIYKFIDYPGYSALNNTPDDFKVITERLFKESSRVANTRLDDKEHKVISVIDRIHTERSMDGYWEWPLNKWLLVIQASTGESTIMFEFIVHKSNEVSFFVHE